MIIVAGMDLDHSGSLEESEYLGDLTFGVNIITKAQWDQADANLAWYKINLAAICYPWAAEFMDNFLDANMFVAADAVWNVPLSCFHAPGFETCWPLRADGKYEYWPEGIDLKANNSLGCDQVNETISMVRKFAYTDPRKLPYRLMKDPHWWRCIESLIAEMAIGEWYTNNPGEDSHVFTLDVDRCLLMGLPDDTDMDKSLNGCRLMMEFQISTVRATPKPLITRFKTNGTIFDIYNWDASDSCAGTL
ncbi:MAG TPA: hypothetical protein P5317_12935 [Myxococcota bacterium]|nr:hypothetical protein [Myxococcota bacterium]